MNAIWRRIVGFVWALVTISDAVSPFRLVAGASVYWCSVGIHCVAIAAAIPVYVLLRRLARSSAGLSFASAFARPVTSLLGTSGGRFFRNKPIALVCPSVHCASPAKIDGIFIAGYEGVRRLRRVKRPGGEVVDESVGLSCTPWPEAAWSIGVREVAAHDALEHAPVSLGHRQRVADVRHLKSASMAKLVGHLVRVSSDKHLAVVGNPTANHTVD